MLFYRYTIRAKLYFVSILFFITCLFFAFIFIKEIYNNYYQSNLIANLSKISVSANKLVHELQKERGFSAGYLASNKKIFANELIEQRKKVNTHINEFKDKLSINDPTIKEFLKSINFNFYLKSLYPLRENVDKLSITSKDAIDNYTHIIKNLIEVNWLVADKSNLDNEIRELSHVLFSLTKIKENTGQLRANINRILTIDSIDFIGHFNVSKLYHENNLLQEQYYHYANTELKEKYDLIKNDDNSKKTRDIIEFNIKNLYKQKIGISPKYWFEVVTKYIDELAELENEIGDIIISTSKVLSDNSKSTLLLVSIVTSLWLIIVLAINYYLVRKISSNIMLVTQKLKEIAKGEINI